MTALESSRWIIRIVVTAILLTGSAGCSGSGSSGPSYAEDSSGDDTSAYLPAAKSVAEGSGDVYNQQTNQSVPAIGLMSEDSAEVEHESWQRRRDALNEVETAQDDLRASVRRLNNGNWEDNLPQVQRRLRNLEFALDNYEAEDADGASSLRWEADRMRRDLQRLDSEDWAGVVPDINRRSRSIEWESDLLVNDVMADEPTSY
jgi:hypothetical protein